MADAETKLRDYATTSASESLMDDLERGRNIMPYLAELTMKGRGYYRLE